MSRKRVILNYLQNASNIPDSSNSAEDKEPLEHQKDSELRNEADEDYTEADIDFVPAAGARNAARMLEVALVVGSRRKEVPEVAGFGAEQELARQGCWVVDGARLRLVVEDLAGMSAVEAELEGHYFLVVTAQQVKEEAVLGSKMTV